MKDPKPLISGEANSFERSLLEAGRADHLPQASRHAILGSLGIAPTFVAGKPLLAKSVGSKWLGTNWLGAKWLAALAVGGAGVIGVTAVAVRGVTAPSAARVVAPQESAGVDQREPVRENEPVVEPLWVTEALPAEPVSVDPAAAAVESVPVRKGSSADSLELELAALDRARRALMRGDSVGALQRLTEYNRSFPRGKLRTESTVLRIEALVAQNKRVEAARLGRAFLERAPGGAYARRVRSLIQEPDRAEAP